MMLRNLEGRKEGRERQTNRQTAQPSPAQPSQKEKDAHQIPPTNAGGTHSTYFLIHLLILNYCCLYHNPTAPRSTPLPTPLRCD
jgi:hypothetical protein